MKNLKHTPAPWKISIEPFTILVTHLATNQKEESICQMSSRYKTDEETAANSKLIAAAPELLEALMEIIKSCDPEDVTPNKMFEGINLGEFYVGGCGIPSNESIHKAINAIKKATE